MSLFIGFLTFILVVNCLFLILLVLVQLPKKEAGAGIAFGAGATDALFGAGSGNALTKVTKYAATSFLGLAVLLTMLNTQRVAREGKGVERLLDQPVSAPVAATPAANQPANPLLTAPLTTTATSTIPALTTVVTNTAPAPTNAPK